MKELSKEELIRQDRNRFIGLETMLKLANSRILITPMNGPNTELAKNLVLAGVKISVSDDSIITADDIETNFLVAADDIGKKRGETVLARLKEMNPGARYYLLLVKEDIIDKLHKDTDWFKQFSFIATSTLDFGLMQKWYELSLNINRPYYNLVNCGKLAFSVISLGSHYTYLMKGEVYMIGNDKYTSMYEVTIHSVPFYELFDEAEEYAGGLYKAILMLREAERRGLKYDPFSEKEENVKILYDIVKWATDKWGDKHKNVYDRVIRHFGVEFCPVYSVVGSVVSQEMIKVLSAQQEPGNNWFLYDSYYCYGNIVQTKAQKNRPKDKIKNEKLSQLVENKK